MNKFDLVIKYADGSPYWSIGFDTKSELNQWLKAEQAKFYWKKDFVVEITDNSKEIEAAEQQAAAAAEEREAAAKKLRGDARAAVKAFKDKPTKTVADVVKLLEVLIDVLDLKPDAEARIK